MQTLEVFFDLRLEHLYQAVVFGKLEVQYQHCLTRSEASPTLGFDGLMGFQVAVPSQGLRRGFHDAPLGIGWFT